MSGPGNMNLIKNRLKDQDLTFDLWPGAISRQLIS